MKEVAEEYNTIEFSLSEFIAGERVHLEHLDLPHIQDIMKLHSDISNKEMKKIWKKFYQTYF